MSWRLSEVYAVAHHGIPVRSENVVADLRASTDGTDGTDTAVVDTDEAVRHHSFNAHLVDPMVH